VVRVQTQTKTKRQSSFSQAFLRTIDQNPENLPRLVGFQEYFQALSYLDRLVRTASPEELKVMDAIVREDPQYAIYVNLSRGFKQAGRSTLSSPPEDDVKFRRHGLAWLIALARVEMGAMLAGFTPSRDPFALVRPAAYDADEYGEIVLDSMRAHVWSIDGDPLVTRIASMNDVTALGYERRLTVALRFIQETAVAYGTRMNEDQRREILRMWERLASLRQTIRRDVLNLGLDAYQSPVFTDELTNTDERTTSSSIRAKPK